jgi:hypothetical protein
MTSLAEIAQITDIDRVAKTAAVSANRIRRLEAEAELAFREWIQAQAHAEEAGLVIDLKVGPGISAALSEFKQRQSKADAKEIAREEMAWPSHLANTTVAA